MSEEEPKRLYTAQELIDLEVPETNFYLEPFVPTEGIGMLFGKPSTYKTTIAYAMATAIATGRPIWGIKADRTAPTLIVQLYTPLPVVKTRFAPALTRDAAVHTFFHYEQVDLVEHNSQLELSVWRQLKEAHS